MNEAVAQRRIAFGMPLIGPEERAAVEEVLQGPCLTHGPRVKEFERAFAEYTRAPFAIAVNSCTAALHLAYLALDIGPGDEVIVPAQTHVATAHAVELVGARPVFCDSEPRTGNMDLDLVESLITPRTKAISPVHYLGLPVDMKRLLSITSPQGLKIVEDCALSLGASESNVHTGLLGDCGAFSFYPAKHITTAEGGMFITRDEKLAATVSAGRAFGIDRNIVSERHLPGAYDVKALGLNYRMSELNSALGVCQLKRLPGILERRCENHARLTALLRQIDEVELLSSVRMDAVSSHYCQVAILRKHLAGRRVEIIERLKQLGVETSVYYPRPVPNMTYYTRRYGYMETDFPVAARLSSHGIALPIGPHLSTDDMAYIVALLKQVIREVASRG
jgi:perosamine synthetase